MGVAVGGAQHTKRAAAEAALLAATESLLAEGEAFLDLPVEKIASRAGMSRPAFYFYFRNKRDLLMRLTEGVTDLLYDQAEQWWHGGTREDLTATFHAIVAVYREHLPLLSAMIEAAGYDEEIGDFWRGLMGRFIDANRDHIEAEQAIGRAPRRPAEPLAHAMVWMAERSIHQHLAREPDMRDEDLVEALVTMTWGAVYGSPSP